MIPDLHPEELFDKAAAGTITASEQATLDAHLASCAACRFEREVALDFAAMPLPNLDVDRLVSNALTARATENLVPRRRRLNPAFAIAAALFAFGSFAAVGQWSGVLPRLVQALVAPAPVPAPVPSQQPQRRVKQQQTQAVPHDEAVSPPPVVEAPPPPPIPPLTPAPMTVAPHPSPARQVAMVSAPVRAPAPVVEDTTPPIPVVRAATPAPVVETPVVLDAPAGFEAANQARLRGDRVAAIAGYRQLLATWPHSPEAALTQATLGRLLLDQGDPAAALRHLDAYLAGTDVSLREEVLSARAVAFMHLGRGPDEVAAWKLLLAQYPQSIHVARAHARLEALNAAP
jgi:hypothetical protein